MRTARNFHHPDEAKVKAAILAVVLFGLMIIGMAGFIIPGGEDPSSGAGKTSEEGHPGSSDAVNDKIADTQAGAPEEGDIPQRERLESLRNSIGSSEPIGHVTLQGRVLDEIGNAVQGAEVKAILIQTMTRALRPEDHVSFKIKSRDEGRFEFDRVPMGKYSLEATTGTLGGHTEAFVADPRKHPSGGLREHDIVLKHVGTIAGRVTGPDGEPVPGALIVTYPHFTCFVRADDQGHFVLTNLEIRIYSLMATAAGLASDTIRDIRIGTRDVEITLSEGGSIRGQVTLDGKPVTGITVTTGDRSWGSIPVEAVTGNDGGYVLSPLGKGHHNPRVLSDEFIDPDRKAIDLAQGEHQDRVNIQLKQNGCISGRVTGAENGEPVEGIWVCAAPKSLSPHLWFDRYSLCQGDAYVLTDRNGCYALSCCSTVDLIIATRGGNSYLPALRENAKTIKLIPGERKDDVDFQIQNGSVLVVKVCTKSGEAVTGAELTLRYPGQLAFTPENLLKAALIPQVIEEADGRYVFDGIPAGVFELEVKKRGWSRVKEIVVVTKGESPPECNIELPPSLTIEGRVLDHAKSGVKNALVNLDHIARQYSETGEDGTFIAHGVSAGLNYITVVAEGYLGFSKQMTIEKGSPPLEFILKSEGTHFLSGVVKNDLGEVLPGVEVSIFQYDGMFNNQLNKTVKTIKDGTFSITGLTEGQIHLGANSDKGHWKDRNHDVGLDRNDLEIILERFARIKGRIKDASGNPVEQFFVQGKSKWNGGGSTSARKSFAEGEFDLDKIPPSEVTLLFSTSEGIEYESEPYILAPGEIREGVSITLKEMGTLTGIIMEKATLKPVNGASIYIHESKNDRFPFIFSRHMPAKATTGEDGSFTIDNQKPGIVDVYAIHPDYAEGCLKQVEVLSGGSTGHVEILLNRGCVVQGHVIVNGQGKSGIEVEADKQNPYQKFQTITGADGCYEMKGLSQAEYEICATLRDESLHSSVRRHIKAKVGEVVDCDLIFEQGYSVEGTVFMLGKPEGGVNINVLTAPGSKLDAKAQQSRSVINQSEQDGAYKIAGLGPGRYRISVNHNSMKKSFSFQEEIELHPGVNRFDIRMGEEGSCEVSGFVYENESPSKNVEVSLSVGKTQSKTTTGSNGAFRFSNLPAGDARLYAFMMKGNSENYFQAQKQFILNEGDSISEDLHIATGSSVLFGDVRENGAPVPNPFIRLEVDSTDGSGKVSIGSYRRMAGDDGYRFECLPAGRYTLWRLRPLRFKKVVSLKANEELRVDFDYATGSGSIQGNVNAPGDDKASSTIGVYLFKPGTCPWKEGKTFQDLSFDEGLLSTPWVDEGSFNQEKLPAGTFDVVAVRQENKQVLELDIKRVTLADGESKTVNLDLHTE